MKALLATIFAVLALTLGACAILPAQPAHTVPTITHTVHTAPSVSNCEEDMPCWNCETMGNHVCGTVESQPMHSTPKATPKAVQATPKVVHIKPTVDAQLIAESVQFSKAPHIPNGPSLTITYVGLGKYSLTGGNLYSVRSIVSPTMWHTYRVQSNVADSPTDTIAAPVTAPTAAATVHPEPQAVQPQPQPVESITRPQPHKSAARPHNNIPASIPASKAVQPTPKAVQTAPKNNETVIKATAPKTVTTQANSTYSDPTSCMVIRYNSDGTTSTNLTPKICTPLGW